MKKRAFSAIALTAAMVICTLFTGVNASAASPYDGYSESSPSVGYQLLKKDAGSTSGKLAAPKNITATVTDTSAKIKWDKVSGADSYRIYFYSAENGSYVYKYTTKKTAYTVKWLKSNTKYKYKVSAVKASKESALSSAQKFTTKKPNKIQAPTEIKAYTTDTDVKLTWKAVEGAVKYKIWFHDYTTNEYIHYYTTEDPYFEKTLVQGAHYLIKLSAVDSSDKESELSLPYRFAIKKENDEYSIPAAENTWKYIDPDGIGTAGHLSGKTVIVTIFAGCKNGSWDIKGKDRSTYSNAKKYIGIAARWLTAEAAGYGKKAEFVYDWTKHPDIIYQFNYNADLSEWKDVYDPLVADIDKKIDTAAIKANYNADNVVFLTFMNFDGRSAAFWAVDRYRNGYKYPYEIPIVKTIVPAVIAHEILHCFGAPDMYADGGKGITTDFIEYAKDSKLNDIMRITWDPKTGKYVYDKILNHITEVTAYYVGLTDSSASVKKWNLPPLEYAA